MKQQFQNSSSKGISNTLLVTQKILFTASTITSGLCFGQILNAVFFPEYQNIYFAVPFTALGVFVASKLDFLGIKKLGYFAFTELFSWLSGHFFTPVYRRVNAALMVACVMVFFTISLLSSWQGSIIAANMVPKVGGANIASVVSQTESQLQGNLKPYRDEVAKVEKRIDEARNAAAAPYRKLVSEGNAWAQTKAQEAKSKAEKQYQNELSAAKKRLAEAEKRESKMADLVVFGTKQEVETVISAAQSRDKYVAIVAMLFGAGSLIVAFVLMLAACMAMVSKSIPKDQLFAKQRKEKQPEDSFDDLYQNP
jgi:Skp family chaperone for outer membrane proteins